MKIFLIFIVILVTSVIPMSIMATSNPHAVYFEEHLNTVIGELGEDFRGPHWPNYGP